MAEDDRFTGPHQVLWEAIYGRLLTIQLRMVKVFILSSYRPPYFDLFEFPSPDLADD